MYALISARPDMAGFIYFYFNLVAILGGFFIFNLFVAVSTCTAHMSYVHTPSTDRVSIVPTCVCVLNTCSLRALLAAAVPPPLPNLGHL